MSEREREIERERSNLDCSWQGHDIYARVMMFRIPPRGLETNLLIVKFRKYHGYYISI